MTEVYITLKTIQDIRDFVNAVILLDYEVDLFRLQPDGAWERDFEEHHQRAYTVEELTAWLEEAGFTAIRTHGELKLRRANERDGRIYFSCIRK